MTNAQKQSEALTRAVTGQTFSNYPAIIMGFAAKGIPETDIRPRENVFTYDAWRALGRQVRRGEHGVKVCTFIPCEAKERADAQTEQTETTGEIRKSRTHTRPWTTTVFHVSQTDAIAARQSA